MATFILLWWTMHTIFSSWDRHALYWRTRLGESELGQRYERMVLDERFDLLSRKVTTIWILRRSEICEQGALFSSWSPLPLTFEIDAWKDFPVFKGVMNDQEVLDDRRGHVQTLWVNKLNSNMVKTTPQMTRFRDAKMCNNWLQVRIDDHRIQSEYKCTIGLQNPEGKNSTLGISAWWNRATRRTTPMTTWPPRPRAPSTQRTWTSTRELMHAWSHVRIVQ